MDERFDRLARVDDLVVSAYVQHDLEIEHVSLVVGQRSLPCAEQKGAVACASHSDELLRVQLQGVVDEERIHGVRGDGRTMVELLPEEAHRRLDVVEVEGVACASVELHALLIGREDRSNPYVGEGDLVVHGSGDALSQRYVALAMRLKVAAKVCDLDAHTGGAENEERTGAARGSRYRSRAKAAAAGSSPLREMEYE